MWLKQSTVERSDVQLCRIISGAYCRPSYMECLSCIYFVFIGELEGHWGVNFDAPAPSGLRFFMPARPCRGESQSCVRNQARLLVPNIRSAPNLCAVRHQLSSQNVVASFILCLSEHRCLVLLTSKADGRLPKSQQRNYSSVFHALYRIARDEGFLTYWRGGGTTGKYMFFVSALAELAFHR